MQTRCLEPHDVTSAEAVVGPAGAITISQTAGTDDLRHVAALRRELVQAERKLRETAEREARRLAEAEHVAWLEAQDACFAFDRIRQRASKRLEAIRAADRERFLGERRLAEMALRDADRADAAYTIISFAKLRDRLRYLRGGAEREAVVNEAIARGGVYTGGCGGHGFQGILR
jgi:hypothetical protein